MNASQIQKSFLFLALIATCQLFAAYDFDKACKKIGLSDKDKNLKIVGQKNSSRSYVTVLQDTATGKKYIIKQLRRLADQPMYVVQEMLGTYIVNWLGLLSQKVIIVPPGEFKEFKMLKDQAATLHTFIPEKAIKDIRGKKRLQLRQIRLRSKEKDHGLTRKIIKSIAQHWDLPAIVAADSFLGIGDRHKANLLFSETLQRFWLIDMDYTYHAVLVDACIMQIDKLLKKSTRLSNREYKALERYTRTLEKLSAQFTTEKIVELIDEFIDQAQITEKRLRNGRTGGYSTIITHIEKSNARIGELINLLHKVLAPYRSCKGKSKESTASS